MNTPGLLLLIDFEKAFDSISWDFLFNVIRFLTLDQTLKDGYKLYQGMLNCVLYKMDSSHSSLILEDDGDKVTQFHHTYSYCVYIFKGC